MKQLAHAQYDENTEAPSSFLDPFAQQLAVVESRADWAGKQISTMLSEVMTLKNGLSAAHQHARGLVSANVSLSHQLSLLLQRNDQAIGENEELKAQNAELLEIARQIALAHSEIEQTLLEERRQNAQLRGVVQELEQALDQDDHEASVLRQTLAERDEEVSALTESLTATATRSEMFAEANRELEALIDADEGAQTKRLVEQEKNIEELEASLKLERANANLQQSERQRAEQEADSLRQEVKRLRSKLLTR